MRLRVTIVVFVMAGVVFAGTLLTPLLVAPIPESEIQALFAWIARIGILIALPVSNGVAGAILQYTIANGAK